MEAGAKPKSYASHLESRKKVCGSCGYKCIFDKNDGIMPKHLVELIKKHQNIEFDIEDPRYPVSICPRCKVALQKKEKGQDVYMPNMPNFEVIRLPASTRSNENGKCFCYICLTGRLTKQAKHKGRGNVRPSIIITETNGMFGYLESNRLESKHLEKKKRSSLTICSTCRQEIGQGINHPNPCTVASASSNISEQIIDTLPEKQQEQVLSKLVLNKAKTLVGNSGRMSNVNMTVATKGRFPSRICLNPTNFKPVSFTTESILDLQMCMGLSNNSAKKLTHWLRVHGGRQILPPYIRTAVSMCGKTLESLYCVEEFEMVVDKYGRKEKRPVFYGNATAVMNAVCDARNITGPCFVKVMADSGQGSFKISVIIKEHDNAEEDDDTPESTRSTYAEGGSFGQGLLHTGVKKTIMLVNVPDIKESWSNCKLLWDLAKINDIPYIFVGDFKITLTLLGLQTATSTYPCPYCFITLAQLRGLAEEEPEESDDYIEGQVIDEEDLCDEDFPCGIEAPVDTAEKVFDTLYSERTFGDLKKDHEDFKKSGSSYKNARLYHSTVNPPIFDEDDGTRVLDKCPIPQLHEYLGIVNHLYFDDGGLQSIVGEEKAKEFAVKAGAVSVGYHGRVFEGPSCRALLKKSEYLMSSEFQSGLPNPILVVPIAQTFIAFEKLVTACFGMGKLKGDVSKLLENFIVQFMALESSVTLKVHIIFEHLIPNLANLGGVGMGLTSEQAGESIHHEFNHNFWSRYKINLLTNPNFAKNWFDANLEFSSKHK